MTEGSPSVMAEILGIFFFRPIGTTDLVAMAVTVAEWRDYNYFEFDPD
jgi:hypothetical protein